MTAQQHGAGAPVSAEKASAQHLDAHIYAKNAIAVYRMKRSRRWKNLHVYTSRQVQAERRQRGGGRFKQEADNVDYFYRKEKLSHSRSSSSGSQAKKKNGIITKIDPQFASPDAPVRGWGQRSNVAGDYVSQCWNHLTTSWNHKSCVSSICRDEKDGPAVYQLLSIDISSLSFGVNLSTRFTGF